MTYLSTSVSLCFGLFFKTSTREDKWFRKRFSWAKCFKNRGISRAMGMCYKYIKHIDVVLERGLFIEKICHD